METEEIQLILAHGTAKLTVGKTSSGLTRLDMAMVDYRHPIKGKHWVRVAVVLSAEEATALYEALGGS